MSLPKVAIVGRPNVGKSSLFNRLARRRVSIVDPTPGVTRDRVTTIIEIDPPLETPKGTPGQMIELTDTGGYGVYVAEGKRYDDVGADLATLTDDIEGQIGLAVEQSDLILFVVDAQAGITALDERIEKLLREAGCSDRVLMVANKVDSEAWVTHGLDAATFGMGEPICVSAENSFGVRDLMDAMYGRLEAEGSSDQGIKGSREPFDAEPLDPSMPQSPDPSLKIAIVGKRNAGKSTLINALAGEERVIVSEIAGTTRDSIDVQFEIEGRKMLAIDTAGLRKRKSFADDIEFYAYHRMLRAIRRADVAALLIDATADVSQVDQKLAQELQRQYKPTVIVVNKWDMVPDNVSVEDFHEYLTKELRGLDFAPIVFISAKESEGLRDFIALAFNLHQQAMHREPTGKLNATIERIMKERGPSSKLGTQAKLLYVSQIEVNPPTIVMVVNKPELFRGNYERYLLNQLREELPFSEVPIRLIFTRRKRKDLAELKEHGRARGE